MIVETSQQHSSRRGGAVMLSKYGDVYPGVNGQYHPYPGSKGDGYPEIETCINWICQNGIAGVDKSIDNWIMIRVAEVLIDMSWEGSSEQRDLISDVLYMDESEVCQDLKSKIFQTYDYFENVPEDTDEWGNYDSNDYAKDIANFINEKFLRVREGGKLNPEGEGAIYFRISSHGYDWHRGIVEYLWETYGKLERMPSRIWIGHDKESNPPETVLFEGSPEELFDSEDRKTYEELQVFQYGDLDEDSKADVLNTYYTSRFHNKKYKSFE